MASSPTPKADLVLVRLVLVRLVLAFLDHDPARRVPHPPRHLGFHDLHVSAEARAAPLHSGQVIAPVAWFAYGSYETARIPNPHMAPDFGPVGAVGKGTLTASSAGRAFNRLYPGATTWASVRTSIDVPCFNRFGETDDLPR